MFTTCNRKGQIKCLVKIILKILLLCISIHTYNIAIQETKNPNLSVQIVMSVILAIHTTGQQKQQQAASSFNALFSSMAAQMAQHQEEEEEKHDREENETD